MVSCRWSIIQREISHDVWQSCGQFQVGLGTYSQNLLPIKVLENCFSFFHLFFLSILYILSIYIANFLLDSNMIFLNKKIYVLIISIKIFRTYSKSVSCWLLHCNPSWLPPNTTVQAPLQFNTQFVEVGRSGFMPFRKRSVWSECNRLDRNLNSARQFHLPRTSGLSLNRENSLTATILFDFKQF